MTNKKPKSPLAKTTRMLDNAVILLFVAGVIAVISLFIYVLINEYSS